MNSDKSIYSEYGKHRARRRFIPPSLDDARAHPEKQACRKPWLPAERDAAILDVGCGWGNFLLSVWAAGYTNLTGVDVDSASCEIARAHLPEGIAVTCGDAVEFLRQRRAEFDLVVCFDVIEHFDTEGAAEFVRAVEGGLKPGGVFVVGTPNCANLVGASLSRHIDVTHHAGYTEHSLFQLLDIAGLEDHELVDCSLNSVWRFWRFRGGLQVRRRLNYLVHLVLYKLSGFAAPRCFDLFLEVRTRKPALPESDSGRNA